MIEKSGQESVPVSDVDGEKNLIRGPAQRISMKKLNVASVVLAALFVLAVPVFAVEAVSIGYSVADAKVRPGGQTNIQLTISNPGIAETPTYINLFISPGPYLTVDPSTLSIASLGLGASQLTNINVKVSPNAVSTTSYVTIKVTYIVSGTSRDTSITVPIKVRRDPVLQIENVTYSKQPEPGISTVMSFDVFNTGEGPARDLRLIMGQSTSIAPTDSSGEIFMTELPAAGKRRIELPITISSSASSGLYTVPFTFSYYDETKSDLYNISKYIGMAVGGKTDFVVTIDSTTGFYFGRTGTASVSISNAGNSPAEFLIVKASSPYGAKEFYVGSLDSDDTETIDVEQVLPMAGGPYDLTLELSWRDKFGTEYTETKTVKLTPESAPVEIGLGTMVVLLVAVGVAWRYRKRIRGIVKK